MKLSKTTIQNLMRLCNGESVAASALRKDIADNLLQEDLLTVRAQGSRRTMRAVDCLALKRYVEDNYTKIDIDEVLTVNDKNKDMTRARLAMTTGDSKILGVRSCPGFPVNSYIPIRCCLHGNELVVCPPMGSFMFIADWKEFGIEEDVVVVGIENMENFRNVCMQRYLFESVLGSDAKLLFVSRYPQSTDLRLWLQTIPNRYIHFGDFDLAGINIFLTEFHKYLGQRSSFFIPKDIDERLCNGSVYRYNNQYARFHSLRCDEIQELQALIDLINKCHRCYDQEGYINK